MDKKLLYAMLLSGLTVLVFQYVMHQKQPAEITDIQAGQSYKVLSPQELQKPLNREIDFLDKKIPPQEPYTTIETDLYKATFSGYGAALETLTFKKRRGQYSTPLKTLTKTGAFRKEEACFLLALDEKTPYFYELVSQQEKDDRHEITFQTPAAGWVIQKIYTIYKHSYQIDLTLSFKPESQKVSPLATRLFFPAPVLGEIADDVQNGIALDSRSQTMQSTVASQLEGNAWAMPEIFGCEDRYFAHTLVSDPQQYVRRGYYKQINRRLFAILEGPTISKQSRWDLSFYFGPKDIQDLALVDERLEGLLNFGWLSWLCKLLLRLLEFLFSYLHNYGLAIIALTLLIKIPLLPLTLKSASVMERYQKLQPQIARIRQQYRHDVKLQHEEIMRFHREHNISPAAQLIGCLPLVIDMPIMIALYKVLGNYMDLYQAPLALWITDLSSKDPYYILPILMGASMLLQQRLAPVVDAKQRIMMIFMSLLMTVIFANFAAGLVLYWFTKNLLTIGETYVRRHVLKL